MSSDDPIHNGPMIAAAITSPATLKIALTNPPEDVDWFEIRADHWAKQPEKILAELPNLKRPLILTVRHPKEGGLNNLSKAERTALFEQFLPYVQMVDIEERSLDSLSEVVKKIKKAQLPLIVSYHDFQRTPSLEKLMRLAKSAHQAGANIFKVAVTPRNPSDVALLIEFLDKQTHLPLAVMGMGPLGKLSRLVCATFGSVLNYSYLDRSQVPGQWPAKLYRERIAELIDVDLDEADLAPE